MIVTHCLCHNSVVELTCSKNTLCLLNNAKMPNKFWLNCFSFIVLLKSKCTNVEENRILFLESNVEKSE